MCSPAYCDWIEISNISRGLSGIFPSLFAILNNIYGMCTDVIIFVFNCESTDDGGGDEYPIEVFPRQLSCFALMFSGLQTTRVKCTWSIHQLRPRCDTDNVMCDVMGDIMCGCDDIWGNVLFASPYKYTAAGNMTDASITSNLMILHLFTSHGISSHHITGCAGVGPAVISPWCTGNITCWHLMAIIKYELYMTMMSHIILHMLNLLILCSCVPWWCVCFEVNFNCIGWSSFVYLLFPDLFFLSFILFSFVLIDWFPLIFSRATVANQTAPRHQVACLRPELITAYYQEKLQHHLKTNIDEDNVCVGPCMCMCMCMCRGHINVNDSM